MRLPLSGRIFNLGSIDIDPNMQLSPLGHTLHRPAASSSRATRLARPAGDQPLAIRTAGCSCTRQVQQRQPTRCAADGQGGGQGKGFRNPFGGGGKKEVRFTPICCNQLIARKYNLSTDAPFKALKRRDFIAG